MRMPPRQTRAGTTTTSLTPGRVLGSAEYTVTPFATDGGQSGCDSGDVVLIVSAYYNGVGGHHPPCTSVDRNPCYSDPTDDSDALYVEVPAAGGAGDNTGENSDGKTGFGQIGNIP